MIFTFFTIASSSISDLIGYIGSLVSDTTPLLVLVLGVATGIWVIYRIVLIFYRWRTGYYDEDDSFIDRVKHPEKYPVIDDNDDEI